MNFAYLIPVVSLSKSMNGSVNNAMSSSAIFAAKTLATCKNMIFPYVQYAVLNWKLDKEIELILEREDQATE